MKRNRNITSRQSGVALLFALLTLLVLSTLAAAIIAVTQTEAWSSSNYQRMLQTRYAAEAGAQNALNWLLYSYTAPTLSAFDMTKYPVQDSATHNTVILSAMIGVPANYPDSTVQTAFSSALKDASVPGVGVAASYEVTAKLLSMNPANVVSWLGGSGGAIQTWQITSQGNVPGIRNAQVQVVMNIERRAVPIINYAIETIGTACSSIDMSSTGYTDSFNSSQGTYTATHQTSGGDVATNGNMKLSGSAKIQGNFSATNTNTGACPGNGITSSSSASPIDTGATTLSTSLTAANPIAPTSPATLTTNQSVSGTCGTIAGCTKAGSTVSLSPSSGYGNLTVTKDVHLTAGTYNMNSLTLSGGSQLVLDSTPVIVNIAGSTGASNAIDLSGGSVSNTTGIASNFTVVYAGSLPSTLSGGPDSYGVFYAPNSAVTMSGSSPWYGAIVSNSYVSSLGSAIHYDVALRNSLFKVGAYYPVSFSWSKF